MYFNFKKLILIDECSKFNFIANNIFIKKEKKEDETVSFSIPFLLFDILFSIIIFRLFGSFFSFVTFGMLLLTYFKIK